MTLFIYHFNYQGWNQPLKVLVFHFYRCSLHIQLDLGGAANIHIHCC